MRTLLSVALVSALLVPALSGCATPRGGQAEALRNATDPAWALRASQDEMIVAVSPARQTLQLAGSTGMVLGASISAVANDKHRRKIESVLEGYDAGAVFETRLTEALGKAVGERLDRVAALGSTAGYDQVRDAEAARYQALAEAGKEVLLDLKMTYGLFGYEGVLITKLDGEVVTLPGGYALYRNTVVASTEPIMANDKLRDPTKQMAPNFTNPRFTVKEGAIDQWLADDGAMLRAQFEAAVDGVVAALLLDLELTDSAEGAYFLGRQALYQKKLETAKAHFEHAVTLRPDYADARNGLSVTLARSGNLAGAIELAKGLADAQPEYGPAYFNLAWWLAVEQDDAEAARPFYAKAQELGMPTAKKVDKALNRE